MYSKELRSLSTSLIFPHLRWGVLFLWVTWEGVPSTREVRTGVPLITTFVPPESRESGLTISYACDSTQHFLSCETHPRLRNITPLSSRISLNGLSRKFIQLPWSQKVNTLEDSLSLIRGKQSRQPQPNLCSSLIENWWRLASLLAENILPVTEGDCSALQTLGRSFLLSTQKKSHSSAQVSSNLLPDVWMVPNNYKKTTTLKTVAGCPWDKPWQAWARIWKKLLQNRDHIQPLEEATPPVSLQITIQESQGDSLRSPPAHSARALWSRVSLLSCSLAQSQSTASLPLFFFSVCTRCHCGLSLWS